jgi:hypothetical protein
MAAEGEAAKLCVATWQVTFYVFGGRNRNDFHSESDCGVTLQCCASKGVKK